GARRGGERLGSPRSGGSEEGSRRASFLCSREARHASGRAVEAAGPFVSGTNLRAGTFGAGAGARAGKRLRRDPRRPVSFNGVHEGFIRSDKGVPHEGRGGAP